LPEDKKKETTTTGGDGAADDKKETSLVSKVVETAAMVTLPIRSIAEEAAARAKEVRLQSLRDKVYGKGATAESKDAKEEEKNDRKEEEAENTGEGTEEKATEAKDAPEQEDKSDVARPAPVPVPLTPSKSTESTKVAGMQSPTTGTWRDGPSTDNVLRTLQSPTSTSWKPTDVDAPITSYRGALVTSPSEEEIAAVERSETIEEEEEPDSDEAEEEDDDETVAAAHK
jgi:hypothetical protein